jgi:hypothetical protein
VLEEMLVLVVMMVVLVELADMMKVVVHAPIP